MRKLFRMEQPPQESASQVENLQKMFLRHAETILTHLGLTWKDLEGKTVADVGAGERYLAAAALKQGIHTQIFSIEPNLGREPFDTKLLDEVYPEVRKEVDNTSVRARREKLPFADNSFDLVLNSSALPGRKKLAEKGFTEKHRQAINNTLDEAVRILKDGGEYRWYPLPVDTQETALAYNNAYREAVLQKLSELETIGECSITRDLQEHIHNGRMYERIILRKKLTKE